MDRTVSYFRKSVTSIVCIVRRKIHIIHLKLASNTSIHRRRLELIHMREKQGNKDDLNEEDEIIDNED